MNININGNIVTCKVIIIVTDLFGELLGGLFPCLDKGGKISPLSPIVGATAAILGIL